MKITTSEFVIELPDAWHLEPDAGRLVAHDDQDREIIVSVWSVVDALIQGGNIEPALIRDELVERARRAARTAASHPDLDTEAALAPVHGAELPSWRMSSVSKDRQVFFAQLVFVSAKSVGLLTFEAPEGADSRALFEALAARVHAS